jgi:hypothetical protein
MKVFVLAGIAAGVGAAGVPPRIELDLTGVPVDTTSGIHDYAASCTAGQVPVANDCTGKPEHCDQWVLTDCPFPTPHAWDSQDTDIDVTRTIYKIDDDGTADVVVVPTVGQTFFSKRRTYLLKYNAADRAGNQADELVFALTLNDVTPPTLTCDDWTSNVQALRYDCSETPDVQACNSVFAPDFVVDAAVGFVAGTTTPKGDDYEMCTDWSVTDNIDTENTLTITYDVSSPVLGHLLTTTSQTEANDMLVSHAVGDNTVRNLGQYTVTASSHDHAGSYGAGEGCDSCTGDNQVEYQKKFLFVDSERPFMELLGGPTETAECGVSYVDEGVSVEDARDGVIEVDQTYAPDSFTGSAKVVYMASDVDVNVPFGYMVNYTAYDASGNMAFIERYVEVRDRTAPTVGIIGDPVATRYIMEDDLDLIKEPGVSAHDDCDTLLNGEVFTEPQSGAGQVTVTMEWLENPNPGNWDTPIVGEYTRRYRVWDTTMHDDGASTLYGEDTRVFAFVDTEQPNIHLAGNATVHLSASLSEGYDDEADQGGATCDDFVGGELSQDQIIQMGNTVDRTTPGTYYVTYKCFDNADPPNYSAEINRTVVVTDHGCPVLHLNLDDSSTQDDCPVDSCMNVEANFPFEDPGAYATDNLDGDYMWNNGEDRVTSTGNTVTTRSIYVEARSCEDIKQDMDSGESLSSGDYFITGYTTVQGFHRQRVFCDMTQTPAKTYKLHKGGAAVVPYGDDDGRCTTYGMSMATLPLVEDAQLEFSNIIAKLDGNEDNPTNIYVCELTGYDADSSMGHSEHTKLALGHAEPGVYTITYHVTDSSGLSDTDCGAMPTVRQVTVTDSFPPVISLHLKGKLLQSSHDPSSEGYDSDYDTAAANPAWDSANNPFLEDGHFDETATHVGGTADVTAPENLMARQSSSTSNAWTVAAAASAVTGLALLAISHKRATAPMTSVPV